MTADFFLQIDGIEGESAKSEHKGAIEILSWNVGVTQSGSMAAPGAGGLASFQDFQFTTPVSKASPKLFLACARGDQLRKAVLTCRRAVRESHVYMRWTFSEVMVSSFQAGGTNSDTNLPMDHFSLNYARVEVEYTPQEADGAPGPPVRAGWSLKLNKAV